ncbi:MAG: hypothetical protein ABI763_17155 [Bacteroidota bacterium]
MKNIFSFFYRYEKYFFLLLVLLHAIPLFTLTYFVTHDGPGHLYNANLINHLLFDRESTSSKIFEFTPGIIPNWISHVLLCFFNLFLQAPVAEKAFQLLYVISFSYSFRLLVKSVHRANILASWLCFPFIYSFTFHIGFYSFSLGLSVLFFVLAYYGRNHSVLRVRQSAVMALCMIALYFSHLFVFLSAFSCIFFFIFWESITAGKNPLRQIVSDSLFQKNTTLFLLASAIPLFFSLRFILANSSSSQMELPVFKYVIEWFRDVRPLIALDYDREKIYSQPLFFVYILIFISAVIRKIQERKKNKAPWWNYTDGWLILSAIMILFFFFLPDDLISGGIIGIRFCLMGYLFLFLFLSANASQVVLTIGAFASIVVSFLMIAERYDSIKVLSEMSESYATCAAKINKGSTLLTINYSDNWMLDNIPSYIGAEKEILVLDNYEASQVHFPLRWKANKNANFIIGTFATSNRPCVDLSAYNQKAGVQVDYILLMEKPEELTDSCWVDLKKQLSANYKIIYSIPQRHAQLYGRLN